MRFYLCYHGRLLYDFVTFDLTKVNQGLNRRGPRLEPFGTLSIMSVCSYTQLLIDTNYFVSWRCDLNHPRTILESPTQFSNLCNITVWSTGSKAAQKFHSTKKKTLSEPLFRWMSFSTFISEVCAMMGMKSWLKAIKKLFINKQSLAHWYTTFSVTLL